MARASAMPEQDAIVSEIEIAAPPERVFQALVDQKQLGQWWNDGSCPIKRFEMDARPGGKWRFFTAPGEKQVNAVREFEAHGEILEYMPPRMLVYTWIANWHDNPAQTTVVSWELLPTKLGTRVKVTHSGLAQLPIARKDYRGGWPGVVEKLKQFIEKKYKGFSHGNHCNHA
jgi:uncharacterized protein YndB with AHSA1/START domain